jgi:nickel/cobalt exporter
MPITVISLGYLPVAIGLGALHALEPGHAKTMTAAYLIGIHGRWSDALLLGLAAALTHSLVVVGIAVGAILLGREAFAGQATWWLQIGSGAVVVLLGSWMLWRRLRPRHHHDHGEAADEDDEDDAHARAHAAQMPAYVGSGSRPAWWQVAAFGAAGGLVPCPASISVMLLALSVGSTAGGLVLVVGFSLGLALALVGVGLAVVVGAQRFARSGRFAAWSRRMPAISAGVVVASGLAAVAIGLCAPAPPPGG